jgi:hypothetical protein
MVKLIYNIPTANNGEQHKDDNNNITKYLELKKDSLLDLAEKIYDNLVEALINNAVDNTSPNPTLSSSSSTFPSSFDQSDIYRREQSEIYPNSKGNIAD